MTIELLTVVAFIESVFLLGVGIIYSYLLYKKEKSLKEAQSNIASEARNALIHAQKKAESIIDHAIDTSDKVLAETTLFKTEIDQKIKATLEKTITDNLSFLKGDAQKITSSYNAIFEQLHTEYLNVYKEAINRIDAVGKKTATDFEGMLKDNELKIRQDLQERMQKEVSVAQAQIEEFKKQEQERISKMSEKALRDLLESIAGTALTSSDHEDIVLKALEKAKKEGLFV